MVTISNHSIICLFPLWIGLRNTCNTLATWQKLLGGKKKVRPRIKEQEFNTESEITQYIKFPLEQSWCIFFILMIILSVRFFFNLKGFLFLNRWFDLNVRGFGNMLGVTLSWNVWRKTNNQKWELDKQRTNSIHSCLSG